MRDIEVEKSLKIERKSADKIKEFFTGWFFGLVYILVVVGFGLLFRFSYQVIGFTLISCGVYGFYIKWLESKGYFLTKQRRRG